MLLRFVLVITAVFCLLPVNAQVVDTNNGSFELTPNPNVLYQAWAWPVAHVKKEGVPPPPPGPYISSALSEMNQPFSSNTTRNSQSMAGTGSQHSPSPLLRPDMPWPVKRFPPKMWRPEGGANYAPDVMLAPPVLNRPPFVNRMPAPPMRYSRPYYPPYTNYPGHFVPSGMYGPYMNRPYMNQQQPMWKPFAIPRSNYPRQNQPVREPVPR